MSCKFIFMLSVDTSDVKASDMQLVCTKFVSWTEKAY